MVADISRLWSNSPVLEYIIESVICCVLNRRMEFEGYFLFLQSLIPSSAVMKNSGMIRSDGYSGIGVMSG